MKGDRSSILATIQVILGVIFFFTGLLLEDPTQLKTTVYICGFVFVLMGIATALLLTSKR